MSVFGCNPLSCFVDNYVHRLVQNKGDGKLVQVEGVDTISGVSINMPSLRCMSTCSCAPDPTCCLHIIVYLITGGFLINHVYF